MTALDTILVFVAAFLAVGFETAFPGLRRLLGAQVDLLPPLMVYAALRGGLVTLTLLASLSGLWFDSLSANPLGVSILPLFAVGLAIHLRRDLLLRDQPLAQFVVGLAASAATPALTLLALLSAGQTPLLGWGSLWQWLVMALGGAVATPVFFELFGWCHRALGHPQAVQTSFRSDRVIQRGRR